MYKGHEPFMNSKEETGYFVIDFWRWAYGSFHSNLSRGILAEFIVTKDNYPEVVKKI